MGSFGAIIVYCYSLRFADENAKAQRGYRLAKGHTANKLQAQALSSASLIPDPALGTASPSYPFDSPILGLIPFGQWDQS